MGKKKQYLFGRHFVRLRGRGTEARLRVWKARTRPEIRSEISISLNQGSFRSESKRQNGHVVQTSMVGRDGVAAQALEGKVSLNRIVVQMPGVAVRDRLRSIT